MTENYPARAEATAPPTDPNEQTTVDVVKDVAAASGQTALNATHDVASSAVEQAQVVAAEAAQHAKDLLKQARGELTVQARSQQERLVGGIRVLADELRSMSQQSPQQGLASDIAQQAASRSHAVASWLDDREPEHLAAELQSFARRRPGAFLAVALGSGLVAGRLTRGVKDASSAPSTPGPTSVARPTPRADDSITLPVAEPYAAVITARTDGAASASMSGQYPLDARESTAAGDGV